jgi:sugar/nucleoside kinase (ribokinase family)
MTPSPVLVVGSIALDTIKTPTAEHRELLGGSATYGAVAASFFSPVNLVAIVGEDFPQANLDYFQSRNIDLTGLQIVPGKTFRWAGEYHEDMNTRTTISTDLNVFEHFTPTLPAAYAGAEIVLLGNIGPDLQNHVLDQMQRPRFVIADTMNLWINIAKEHLLRLLQRVDMLVLNDEEARQLTGEKNLITAGHKLRALGPKYIALKKGEHGCLLFGENEFFTCGAYPLESIFDPTGAGDSFVGALAGYLAANAKGGEITFDLLRRAVVHGSVLASFNVEQFSLERLRRVTPEELAARYDQFRVMMRFHA